MASAAAANLVALRGGVMVRCRLIASWVGEKESLREGRERSGVVLAGPPRREEVVLVPFEPA